MRDEIKSRKDLVLNKIGYEVPGIFAINPIN